MVAQEQSLISILPRAREFRRCNLSNDHWQQILKLIPNYNNISNYQFKALLFEFISPCDINYIIMEWLNNFSIIQYLHKHAELMSIVSQLKIELNYWNYLTNIITSEELQLSNISPEFTAKNSVNWDHSRTEDYIERRKNHIEHKLQQAERDLNTHSQQTFPFYFGVQNMYSIEYYMNILSIALTTLVQSNLQYLHTNFEQKKILWQFDINDICLVKAFYALNPTDEQVRIYLIDRMCQSLFFTR